MAKTEAQREANRQWHSRNKEKLAQDPVYIEAKNEASRRARAKNPGGSAEIAARSIKNNCAGTLLRNAKSRAKSRGQQCTIDKTWVEKKLKPMRCSVTGVELVWAPGSKGPLLPSLDRVDPSKGYTVGNTRVTSCIFNRARGTFTDEEVLEYLVKPLAN